MEPNSVSPPNQPKKILTWWTSREKPMGSIWAVAKTLGICCIWLILPSYINGIIWFISHEIRICLQLTQYFMVHVSQRSLPHLESLATPCRLLLHWWFLVPKVADWHHGPRCESVKMFFCMENGPWFGEQWKFFFKAQNTQDDDGWFNFKWCDEQFLASWW